MAQIQQQFCPDDKRILGEDSCPGSRAYGVRRTFSIRRSFVYISPTVQSALAFLKSANLVVSLFAGRIERQLLIDVSNCLRSMYIFKTNVF